MKAQQHMFSSNMWELWRGKWAKLKLKFHKNAMNAINVYETKTKYCII
jgi:hypothetical protein